MVDDPCCKFMAHRKGWLGSPIFSSTCSKWVRLTNFDIFSVRCQTLPKNIVKL